jgi:formylglycine-generating enzyme required for sulfatase activity
MKGDGIKADYPIYKVSWNECSGFCIDASKALGCTVRLPMDKEWEFACRAGTTGGYIWADTAAPREANVSTWVDANGAMTERRTTVQQGGQFRANPWGAYDMVGNVDEWVFDMYTTDEAVRVVRDNSYGAPVFWRFPHLGKDAMIKGGFRIAVDIDPNFVKVATQARTTTTSPAPTTRPTR